MRSLAFIGYCTALLLGALNDYVFRFLLVFYISKLRGTEADPGVIAIAGVVFVVPFLCLTPMAGTLADKFSKSRLLQMLKGLEVVVMALGFTAFCLKSPLLLFTTMGLMAAQSALLAHLNTVYCRNWSRRLNSHALMPLSPSVPTSPLSPPQASPL